MLEITGYYISDKIYDGANSIVYRARRQKDNLPVVLKMLKKEYPVDHELAAFEREYRITSQLQAQGTVRAYSLKKLRNTLVMVLEDFGGHSLTLLKKMPAAKTALNKPGFYDLPAFLSLALQITDCLEQIHEQGIVHKDINPDNIACNPENNLLKIIDFGISTDLPRENLQVRDPQIPEGTLNYISPEQTGRMNRYLDYRSDLYSLGATFYHLLTGKPPFADNDPMEMVHCHIAKKPHTPLEVIYENTKLKSGFAENLRIVGTIILKLLRKDADERYQSIWGLKHDLNHCLQELEQRGRLHTFKLASRDISQRLNIPQKLYGRKAELQMLLEVFERSKHGKCEMLLVKGYSGIGKSLLVKEVFKPLSRKQTYFIYGKFDQLQGDSPYLALVQAFRDMMEQILTESGERFTLWKEKLQNTLGNNAGVITQVIPELEQIIGLQPNAPELNPEEDRNRFHYLFSNFISVLTQTDRPLVLFLDDLQWADLPSLQLIEIIINSQPENLLLIGAYRDNELKPGHPLLISLENIRKSAQELDEISQPGSSVCEKKNLKRIRFISLGPLELEDVKNLLADSFKTSEQKVHFLAELCMNKTGGNPFFLNQFIRTLYLEKLISFDRQRGLWKWKLPKIEDIKTTDNVIDLMTRKINKLSEPSKEILKHAACIGSHFDLQTLALILEKTKQQTIEQLWEALQEELIHSLDDIYKMSGSANPRFCFLHDRVQQAAYLLIEEAKRNRVHLKIGRLLLNNLSKTEQEEQIFDIVNHFNPALDIITEMNERETLARLNLLAGKKAKAAAAYKPAADYLQYGLDLLRPNSWQTSYELTMNLHNAAMQVAFLNADYRQMQELGENVLHNAASELDKVQVFENRIFASQARNELLKGLQTGLQAAKSLGHPLPERPSKAQIIFSLLKTKYILKNKNTKDLHNLPLMTDPRQLAFNRIAASFGTSAYMTAPELLPLLVHKCLKQALEHGLAPESPVFFVIYGFILSDFNQDFKSSYKFGKLALDLSAQFKIQKLQTTIAYLYNMGFRHLRCPLRESLGPLLENRQKALEAGNFQYSAYSTLIYCIYLLLAGENLVKVEEEINKYTKTIFSVNQKAALNLQQVTSQAVQNLKVTTETPYILLGENFNEQTALPDYFQAGDKTALFVIFFFKTWLGYLFNYPEKSLNSAQETEKYLQSVAGFYAVPVFYFYDSLVRLALLGRGSNLKRFAFQRKVAQNQDKLKKWAILAPENNLHKWTLVEAERAAQTDRIEKAMNLYDQAVQGARKSGFLQEEALSLELAGRFYEQRGNEFIAGSYLIEARYCYQKWGAQAKVEQLDQLYPRLKHTFTSLLKTKTDRTHFSTENNLLIPSYSSSDTQNLDYNTVLKALHTISGEIVLENLLRRMLQMVLTNSGASRAVLLLNHQGIWYKEAQASAGEEEVSIEEKQINFSEQDSIKFYEASASEKLSALKEELPKLLLQYIIRTSQTVLINDTSQNNKFSNDPYLFKNPPKSLLGLPILSQGNLTGMLYLENNLLVDIFTPRRVQVVQLLAAQTAISIQNARLYGELESLVRERTRELTEANTKLEELTVTDNLTSLYNRLKMDELMTSELTRAQRYKRPFSLILIDLDDFKLINDNLGHLAGDKVLQELSLILLQNIRDTDFICRWGGEEFAVLCPETDKEQVMNLAKKIRQLVAEHKFACQRQITISLGATTLKNEDTRHSMFARADQALYKSKADGKNTSSYV